MPQACDIFSESDEPEICYQWVLKTTDLMLEPAWLVWGGLLANKISY